jgi:uncharacterized protein YxjI
MSTPSTGAPDQNPWGERSAPAGTADARRAANFQSGTMDDRFSHRTYLLQKQFWKMFGGAFRFYDPNGNLVFYSRQKAFKLKEDIRLFTGEDMTREVLSIQARNILDFSATYDVTDSTSGQKIGALKRKGLKSMLQDEWQILDLQDAEIGLIREESTALAVLRRFVEMASYLLPQTFLGTVGNRPVFTFKQNHNPFLGKINLDFSADVDNVLDRRLGIAAAVLLCAIEGKQR